MSNTPRPGPSLRRRFRDVTVSEFRGDCLAQGNNWHRRPAVLLADLTGSGANRGGVVMAAIRTYWPDGRGHRLTWPVASIIGERVSSVSSLSFATIDTLPYRMRGGAISAWQQRRMAWRPNPSTGPCRSTSQSGVPNMVYRQRADASLL